MLAGQHEKCLEISVLVERYYGASRHGCPQNAGLVVLVVGDGHELDLDAGGIHCGQIHPRSDIGENAGFKKIVPRCFLVRRSLSRRPTLAAREGS
jgi:hypothetical protein